ncbi:uncharacterized protein MELLADRAFT_64770 [Melampsora larici-populina 98AG31]|uniref:Uncharacterized protein n=1 Tax=Melampsora larici-populina (strain 98AG31 / pathotype 3-4-7) TaxID=747676 RepID=F4RSQ3_MELLP|nr:uncharacterized protein MELLADRAFT_64770 [Melampsora larici-populina 98AG31]EGG04656.1 hypothetical protein MELLADRAFT_64770 [Melampsora larici-populina 98AG31]
MAPKPTPYKPLNKRKRPATDLQATFWKQEDKDAKEMNKVRTQTSDTQALGIGTDGSAAPHEDNVDNFEEHGIDDRNETGYTHNNDHWEDIDEDERIPFNELSEEERRIILELNSNLYQA